MSIKKQNLAYKGVAIRRKQEDGLLSITDLWKAEGSPSSKRPDKWFKSPEAQDYLESLLKSIKDSVKRDENGKIIGAASLLEVVRGGDRSYQGTFANPPVAIAYGRYLSEECGAWVSSLFVEEREEVASTTTATLAFPTSFEDFGDEVRVTPDGRVSVYDAIAFSTGHKNPYQVWSELTARIPVFLQKTEEYKFDGKGGKARLTPVVTLEVFLEILVTLPGRLANTVREESVRTLVRVMKGDPSLIEEILQRIYESETLADLELAIRERRVRAYGEIVPLGTSDNPLSEITPQIKKGYGWAGKEKQMTDLLVELATYRGGMVIHRQVPYKAYSQTSKDSKTRRIDLTLQLIENLDVLHLFQFEPDYVDDADVTDVFLTRAYPEVAYKHFSQKGIKYIVAHLVSPGGITDTGIERMKEVQEILDKKCQNRIKLDSMLLGELVWGEFYPAIERMYNELDGKYGRLFLYGTIRPICNRLCDPTTLTADKKALQQSKLPTANQLSLF